MRGWIGQRHGGEPAAESLVELCDVDWFRQEVVHASGETETTIIVHGVSGESDDGDAPGRAGEGSDGA